MTDNTSDPEPQTVIRVVVADDHPTTRRGTCILLDAAPDIEVVGEAENGRELVELVGKHRPDVAVADISMPILNGIEATKQIKATVPETAVLILTAYDDDLYVFALLEAEAAGYLLKDVSGSALIAAVRQVHAGEPALHPAIAKKLLRRLSDADQRGTEPQVSKLTARETEVLQLVARGYSNAGIAAELSLSVRTVQSHLTQVFGKLEVGSRTGAVAVGLRRGLVSLDRGDD